VALVLAVELFLVALDARAWDRAFRADDVVFRVVPARARWSPRQHEPFGLARRLMGVGDDVALRRAFSLFERSRQDTLKYGLSKRPAASRARAAIALAALERGSSSPHDRAVAANLLGLIAFDDAAGESGGASQRVLQSTAAFRRAIVLDPTVEDAKINLEVMLRFVRATAEFNRQNGTFGTAQGPGTGSGRGGSGY
jgi:hypothetical protein